MVTVSYAVTAEDDISGTDIHCPNITQDLQRYDCDQGTTGSLCMRSIPGQQVTELQRFLMSYYPSNTALAQTGKFLNATRSAVRQFQLDMRLITQSDVGGRVGALTRAKISVICREAGSAVPPQDQPIHYPGGGCIFNGFSVPNGGSVLGYAVSEGSADQCASMQVRICTQGTLSGSYSYASCTVRAEAPLPAVCTPLPEESRTVQCGPNQVGSITQRRTSSCTIATAAPTWSDWFTTTSTCITPVSHTEQPQPAPTYSWRVADWSQCTNSQQTRVVECVSNGGVVADAYCTAAMPSRTNSCTPSSVATDTDTYTLFVNPASGMSSRSVDISAYKVGACTATSASLVPYLEMDFGDGSLRSSAWTGGVISYNSSTGKCSIGARMFYAYQGPGTFMLRLIKKSSGLEAATKSATIY